MCRQRSETAQRATSPPAESGVSRRRRLAAFRCLGRDEHRRPVVRLVCVADALLRQVYSRLSLQCAAPCPRLPQSTAHHPACAAALLPLSCTPAPTFRSTPAPPPRDQLVDAVCRPPRDDAYTDADLVGGRRAAFRLYK